MAKDETVVGITGKPVPKPRTAKQQYELEKKRRMEKHLGKNVGGVQYRSDVTPYYNPRARTYREFVEIAEAQRLSHKFPLSKDELATVQRIRDRLNDKPPSESPKQVSPTRSARKVRRIDFVDRSNVRIREESEVAEKPASKQEKDKIKKMQTLHRLMKAVKSPKYQSDVAREEFEIDEAKVEAGMSDIAKKDIRSRRFVGAEKQKDYDAMGPTAANWVSAARLRAHRERDELNKDAKDIRRGKLDRPQFQGKTGQERIAAVKKAKGMK